jgi:hypothetical protein
VFVIWSTPRHRAVHPAQVRRAGADVDDEHVVEHVEAVRDRERLGAQHHAVHRLARGLDDRVLVVDRASAGTPITAYTSSSVRGFDRRMISRMRSAAAFMLPSTSLVFSFVVAFITPEASGR